MTTFINASSSAGLVITPDTSGNIQLQYNGVAAPAFYAYRTAASGTQSITSATATKVQLNGELWDTANYFDSTTNYRFTPLVAGYYQFNWMLEGYANGSAITTMRSKLYKNGSEYARSNSFTASYTEAYCGGSVIGYANGSTDYFELYAEIYTGGSAVLYGDPSYCYLSGCLLRGA
jgi:hypothetical protein